VERRQGKGSLFSVYLPIAAGGRSLPAFEDEAIPKGQGQYILAVDDEEFFLDIIRQYLEGLDYQVDAFHSGQQALAAFDRNPQRYHLIISDQTMPGMTGVELITEIRRKNKEIPVILCTGYSDLVTEQTAPHYGITQFLQKPVSRRELGTAVNRLMSEDY
jgi:CheY-like chemotaxis protein